jgi:hypothetical protein
VLISISFFILIAFNKNKKYRAGIRRNYSTLITGDFLLIIVTELSISGGGRKHPATA